MWLKFLYFVKKKKIFLIYLPFSSIIDWFCVACATKYVAVSLEISTIYHVCTPYREKKSNILFMIRICHQRRETDKMIKFEVTKLNSLDSLWKWLNYLEQHIRIKQRKGIHAHTHVHRLRSPSQFNFSILDLNEYNYG